MFLHLTPVFNMPSAGGYTVLFGGVGLLARLAAFTLWLCQACQTGQPALCREKHLTVTAAGPPVLSTAQPAGIKVSRPHRGGGGNTVVSVGGSLNVSRFVPGMTAVSLVHRMVVVFASGPIRAIVSLLHALWLLIQARVN